MDLTSMGYSTCVSGSSPLVFATCFTGREETTTSNASDRCSVAFALGDRNRKARLGSGYREAKLVGQLGIDLPS